MQDERTEKSYSDMLSKMGLSTLTKVKIAGYDAWYPEIPPLWS